MLKFESMLKNENKGTILSFMENTHAIIVKKMVSKLNNDNINIDCPIHGEKDALIGVVTNENIPEFIILESCCDFHKKSISDFLENQK